MLLVIIRRAFFIMENSAFFEAQYSIVTSLANIPRKRWAGRARARAALFFCFIFFTHPPRLGLVTESPPLKGGHSRKREIASLTAHGSHNRDYKISRFGMSMWITLLYTARERAQRASRAILKAYSLIAIHMPVTFEGTLKIFVKKQFEKDGETVEYYEAYFVGVDEDDNDQVLKCNTKQDLTSQIDKTGVARLQLQQNGKLSLKTFSV